MDTFSMILAICAGNSPVTGEFPAQRPVTRSFDISLICAWINGWVNTRDAGDLRRHRANYDVIVISCQSAFRLLNADAMALKQQSISIHSIDELFIVHGRCDKNMVTF